MPNTPVNVQRLIRQTQQYAEAEKRTHEIHEMTNTSHWFVKQFKLDANRSTKPVSEAGPDDERVRELVAAQATMSAERKRRMKMLYETERAAFAAELATQGKAFQPPPK